MERMHIISYCLSDSTNFKIAGEPFYLIIINNNDKESQGYKSERAEGGGNKVGEEVAGWTH